METTPPKEICTGCGKLKPVQKRLEGGKPQCQTCYDREYRKMHHKKEREKKTQ